MKNKVFHAFLVFAFVAFSFPIFAFTGGSGTYEDPYNIFTYSDVADLVSMATTNNCSGVYFLQTADIDLSMFANFDGVGSYSRPFSGNYDGDGYCLSNMTRTATITDSSGETYHAFFNVIGTASLANMVVHGSIKIVSTSTTSSGIRAYVGGIVGRVTHSSLLEALESYVDIKYINTVLNLPANTTATIGGVVGRSDANGNLTWAGLVNHGSIYVEEATVATFGGILGFISNSNTTLLYCENHGLLSAYTHSNASVAGLMHANNAWGSLINKCYNYGDICITGRVQVLGGFCSEANTGSAAFRSYVAPKYCANYGDITLVDGFNGIHAVSAFISGGSYGGTSYDYCTNYGDIRVEAEDIALCEIGVFSSCDGGSDISNLVVKNGCVNYGDITYISSKANGAEEVSIGGIQSSARRSGFPFFQKNVNCENHGNITLISANKSASAKYGIAGIGCVSSPTENLSRYSLFENCVNFGTLVMEVPNDFQGIADISGVCSAYSEQKCDIRMNWCYNLGSLKWNGNNVYVGGLMGLEDAETSADEYIHINHSYSVCSYNGSLEGNYVGSVVGYAKSTTAPITVSNSFGVAINRNLPAFGYFDNAYTNNVKSYAWEEVYRDLNISGFYLPSSKFNQPSKTSDFFDLICPMNTEIFPTDTDEAKRLHNAVLVNGYRRYIKTIQQ